MNRAASSLDCAVEPMASRVFYNDNAHNNDNNKKKKKNNNI